MIAAGGSPTPTPVFYDRLVFDGTAYIDTDIVPGADASFRIAGVGYESEKAAQRVFATRAGDSASTGMFYGSGTTTTNRSVSVVYGSSSTLLTKTIAFSTSAYSFFLTPNRMGYGNTAYAITKGSAEPTGGLVIGYNASHSGQAYTGRMGIFRIYGSDAQNVTTYSGFDSYTAVYTLRPCTYNGEAGLWCVETSTFYGNSAESGTLTVMNNS